MSEPVITEQVNEGVGLFDFSDPSGYTFDSQYVEFDTGKLKLKDLGGGTYNSGMNLVVTPPLQPDKVKKWLRLSSLFDTPTGTGVLIEVQFSNDEGSYWGIEKPEYNDGGWVYYTTAVFDNYYPNENGRDVVRIRITLISDGADTPEVDDVEISWFIHSAEQISTQYTPLMTSKQIISDLSLGTVKAQQINDTNIKYSENWVVSQLRRVGIDWTEFLSDEYTKTQLEKAASYRTLCITGQFGIGSGVAGPIQSISGDGISKSFASVTGIYKGAEGSPMDFCEMAKQELDTLIDIFRAGEAGSAQRSMRGFARDNEMLDMNAHATSRDVRRRYYDE